MKRTADEIFSLLPRICTIIWKGDWYLVTGHNEDTIFCECDNGDECHIELTDLDGQEADLYEEVIITDQGCAPSNLTSNIDPWTDIIGKTVLVPMDGGEVYKGVVNGITKDKVYIGGPVGAVSHEWFDKFVEVQDA